MNYVDMLRASIGTSLELKIFTSTEKAANAHIFHSSLVQFPLAIFRDPTRMANFNPERLQPSAAKAYPPSNRPRGADDLSAVNFYKRRILAKKDIPPIFVVFHEGRHVLLDGAHRVVAAYITDQPYVYAYLIKP
jgi:hypothetical protein